MTHQLAVGGLHHKILAVVSHHTTQAENSYQHTEAIGLRFLIKPQTCTTDYRHSAGNTLVCNRLATRAQEEIGLQHSRLVFCRHFAILYEI